MRNLMALLLIGCLFAAMLTGCANRREAVTAQPSAAELPDLSQADEYTQQAMIKVQGRDRRPRFELVVLQPEPKLTPEQQRIVGQVPQKPEFLMFPAVIGPRGDLVRLPVHRGRRARSAGVGGAVIGTHARKVPTIGRGPAARITKGSAPVPRRTHGVHNIVVRNIGVGPDSGHVVGVNPATKVAGRHDRRPR